MLLEKLGVNYTSGNALPESSFLPVEEPEDEFNEQEKFMAIFIVFNVRFITISLSLIVIKTF